LLPRQNGDGEAITSRPYSIEFPDRRAQNGVCVLAAGESLNFDGVESPTSRNQLTAYASRDEEQRSGLASEEQSR
jgi:hypothetical protein